MAVRTHRRTGIGRLLAGLVASVALAGPALADGQVNIYSYRQPALIKPLLDAFTTQTGIRTNVVFAQAGLEERIATEGENSPADVLLSVDVGRLDAAVQAGITQPIISDIVASDIPAQYRDPQGNWIGLTQRGRVVYASRERVKDTEITYEELADPKWKGKLCTRSGQHVYNIGLFASLVAHHGVDKATEIIEGIKNNLAMKPSGGDREQAKAIAAGQCDIALGNTYYVGLMETNEKDPEQKQWAEAMRIIFPNANDRGTSVNISGVVLAKNAPNKADAIKLIEFLTTDKAQELYATANFEYPVKPGVPISPVVAAWGPLKADPLPLAELAANRKAASEIVDKVDFDAGPSN